MKKRFPLVATAFFLMSTCSASAQEQYPLLDMVAEKVIQKYQQSSCEQLWIQKSQEKSPREQEIIQLLRNDPQMRQIFLNRSAGPIANKMFECGMIP